MIITFSMGKKLQYREDKRELSLESVLTLYAHGF